MRFRKSIKVTKGVKLNLSKGGASFTVGSGLPVSLNVGTKGAYLNWSIPGTGVYDRVRLDKMLKEKLGGVLGFGTAAAEEEQEETGAEKSTKKTGAKATAKKSSSAKTTAKSTAKKTSSAKTETKKESDRPSDEEMNAIAQEIALVNIHRQAVDVSKKASGALDADKGAVMIDLDLPEIEDMPQDKLTQLADGTLKIKKKSQKESREDYKTCVFGLGEYVAGNVFGLVPAAERIAVSAYTQRRSEKTGDAEDVFIYSVVFERSAFKKGYQKKEPAEFCDGMKSRYYVLASGVMKQIAPFEAEEL